MTETFLLRFIDHTQLYTHTHTHTRVSTHTHSHSDSHTHTHKHTRTHKHTHTLALTQTRTHTHIHTHTHTHTPVGLLWTSDQSVAQAATYTTHSKPNRQTSVPSARFEPSIPGIEKPQNCSLDLTATGIGLCTSKSV